MKATIKFRTDRATDWYVTKEFADEKHIDNYIGYICRTKQGYLCDEVFYDRVKFIKNQTEQGEFKPKNN